MTQPDIKELRRIAGEATAGPWVVADPLTVVVSQAEWPMVDGPEWHDWTWAADSQHGRFVAESATNEAEGRANAAHIAAFNPVVALALLNSHDALASEVERLKGALEPFAEAAGRFNTYGSNRTSPPKDDAVFFGWPDHKVTIGDFRRARAALEPTHGS